MVVSFYRATRHCSGKEGGQFLFLRVITANLFHWNMFEWQDQSITWLSDCGLFVFHVCQFFFMFFSQYFSEVKTFSMSLVPTFYFLHKSFEHGWVFVKTHTNETQLASLKITKKYSSIVQASPFFLQQDVNLPQSKS